MEVRVGCRCAERRRLIGKMAAAIVRRDGQAVRRDAKAFGATVKADISDLLRMQRQQATRRE